MKRLWLLVPGALALALTWLAQLSPTVTEMVYARGIYPWLSSIWGFLPSLVSWSAAQWVVVAALAFCAGWLVFYIVALVHGRGKRGLVLWKALTTMAAAVSVGYCIFALMCGLNYYRLTFAEDAGFELRESTTEELVALCENLATSMNEEREAVASAVSLSHNGVIHNAENAVNGEVEGADESLPDSTLDNTDAYAAIPDEFALAQGGFEAYAVQAVEDMRSLAEIYPVLSRPLYSPPKPVLFSETMSYLDIAGIYFPFTVESNINVDGPFFTIPATMGHELAHQCGFMREDEANFIGYLSCKNAADPLTRYSGYSLAYDYALSALIRTDREAAVAVNDTLSDAVRADQVARAEYLKQFEGPVAEASNAANNVYLKANQQTDGTRSYGRMVDLLLAEARQSD
ncbi:DUF3810 domain-containing protein [Adlercreutzia caecimuris]|uniref:DUF3810 domain-containing protein n=1 Tax=Adlercreutzia caecimuris TaxID=671266 RepID=UPI001C3D9879|nr:DUF3810 domain-containing protein [Adlercreutzia caecimuris]MCR2037492.1 DUF3810 domain-containing protein [Adlercreutzia caecimuris]